MKAITLEAFQPITSQNATNDNLIVNEKYILTKFLTAKLLRDKHDIHVLADCNHSGWFWEVCKTNGTCIKQMTISLNQDYFSSYEDAYENGLIEALKIIK